MALYNIGGHYFSGKGVELSFTKAAEYYHKAAAQGFAPAQVCVYERLYLRCMQSTYSVNCAPF